MRKEASLPIRLDADISRRLDLTAEALGMTKSAIIRILVHSFVEQFEADGGKITLPLQWHAQRHAKNTSHLKFVAEKRASYTASKVKI